MSTAPVTVSLDARDLTAKQLLLAVFDSTLRMEQKMADLQQALIDLTAAVQGVAERVGPTVDQLRAQVAAGEQALADFAAADAAEDANYEAAAAALQAAVQAQVDAAQAAADTIEGQVAVLNQVAPTQVTAQAGAAEGSSASVDVVPTEE